MKKDIRIGYMCLVDFNFELGEACGGNVIYPSVKDLKANRTCWEECGIVKVNISLDKVISHGNNFKTSRIKVSNKDLKQLIESKPTEPNDALKKAAKKYKESKNAKS